MRSQASMSVICGMVFALLSGPASAAGREAGDACTFLSQSRVSALGDDAYYIDTPGFGLGINVRKGAFAFQAKVFGFSSEMTKTLEGSLAQAVLAKR